MKQRFVPVGFSCSNSSNPIHNPVYAFTAGIWLLQKRNYCYYRVPKNVQQCFQIQFSLFSMLPLPYPSPKKKHSVIYPHWYSWPFLLLLVRKKKFGKRRVGCPLPPMDIWQGKSPWSGHLPYSHNNAPPSLYTLKLISHMFV